MVEPDTSKITSRLGASSQPGELASPDVPTGPLRPRPSRSSRAPASREQDQHYNDALALQAAGDNQGALLAYEQLLAEFPNHAHARVSLFQLAVALRDRVRVAEHHDFIVGYYLQTANTDALCQAYRETRLALPELGWSEKALIHVMHAGDKGHDARVAVDAAKLLIHTHPTSPTVPRAMLLGARVQEQEGRPDLARATLQNIISHYPRDPVVEVAKRRLAMLT